MKSRTFLRPILPFCAGLAVAASAQAAPLYYNTAANPGWNASNAWGEVSGGPYSTWVDGSTAVTFNGGAATINVTQNVALGGLQRSSTNTTTLSKSDTPSSPVSMTFSGGNIDAGSNSEGTTSGSFTFGHGVTLTGNLSLSRGNLNLGGTVGNFAAHSGSIDVTGGVLNVDTAARLSGNSNIHLQSGAVVLKQAGSSSSIGDVLIDAGTFNIGSAGGSGLSLEVKSLAGTGGALRANVGGSISTNPQHALLINQDSDTVYSGTISGVAPSGGTGSAYLVVTKAGEGDLTLSGSIQGMERTTTVNGGRLYVNSSSTSFGDTVGSTAIQVNTGGSLGGSGVITTLAGDTIVVANGGALVAGTAGAADRTTYALGDGGTLNLSAATAQSGWLRFDLGASTQAGITYSQVLLSNGDLQVGLGSLNFDDFDFHALAGFGAGTYTLFSVSDDIVGNLGTSLTGTINGFESSLSQDETGIYLSVVPEPGTWLLVGVGLALAACSRRRKIR